MKPQDLLVRMKKLDAGTPHRNGNTLYRGSDYGGDRYRYDFKICTPEDGWKQYDTHQDASYFGVWVSITGRMIFTYCEGDTTLEVAQDDEGMRAALKELADFYGEAPPMAVSYDAATGQRTEYFDERPTI